MYITKVSHIGLTVTNLQRSIEFYRDILGLYYKGQMVMEGASSDELFQRKNIYAKVAYLSYSKENSPADIELIEFVGTPITKRNPSLFETSISELCFEVWDIEKFYEMLKEKNIKLCLVLKNLILQSMVWEKVKPYIFMTLTEIY